MKTKYLINIFILLILPCIACGRKTAPEPPEDRAPKSVSELNVSINNKNIVLSWKAPTQNVKGDELLELDSFLVFKREYKLAQQDEFREVASVQVGNKEIFSYTDSNIENGKTYDYLVSAVSDEGVDGVNESFVRVTFNGQKSTSSITPYKEEVK